MNAPDIFLDTSVLVRGLVEGLPHHRQARSYLDDARQGAAQVAISTHALAELFATLTALPTRPRHSPADAHTLIDGATRHLQVVSLDAADYRATLTRMAELGLSSGAIYDALHVRAAEKTDAAELVTYNGQDFGRMPPEEPTRLTTLPKGPSGFP